MDGQSFTSIVLGETGVGKSAFINAINQKRELKISDGPYNCTKYIQGVIRKYNGQSFLFLDTPGFSFPKTLMIGEYGETNLNLFKELWIVFRYLIFGNMF